MRKLIMLLMIGILALLLSGCGQSSSDSSPDAGSQQPSASQQASEPGSASSTPPAASSPSTEATDPDDSEQSLLKTAQMITDMLRNRDLEQLATVVDPQEGLLFSPYPHIDKDQAQTFTAETLPSFQDTNKLEWGAYDGSGEPIVLTFREYFETFVYDQDFASAPDINAGKLVGQGNVMFNGLDVYPDASYVEFHYPGFDEDNAGMDWESLILVMRPDGSDWRLCAIVHAQWTI